MMKLQFFLFIVLFVNLGCKGQVDISEYVERIGDTIHVKASFTVLSQLAYTTDTEPFIVCLRDQYAYKFGNVKMHMEHSDYRQLYGQALGFPTDYLENYSDEEFRLELERIYFTKGKQDLFKKMDNLFVLTIVQNIDNNGTKSTVACKERDFKYDLEKINKKWVIVGFGPHPPLPATKKSDK